MNFIIGSGIVGLIVGTYFNDFTILSKGKGQDAIPLGPRILKATPAVVDFIEREINSKKAHFNKKLIKQMRYKCGYIIGDGIKEIHESIKDSEKEEYLKKTRGKNWEQFIKSGMNDGINVFSGYDMCEVYNALYENHSFKSRRIFININKIDTRNKAIRGSNPLYPKIKLSFNYSKIINTLPIETYKYLSNPTNSAQIDKKNKIYVYHLKSWELYKAMEDYNFIYFTNPSVPYYRMTKINNGIVTIESNIMIMPKKEISGVKDVVSMTVIPFGKIVDTKTIIETDDVEHIGRYAQHDNNIRIHNIIEKLEAEKKQ